MYLMSCDFLSFPEVCCSFNSATTDSETIPTIAGPPSICLSCTQDCGVCLSCLNQGYSLDKSGVVAGWQQRSTLTKQPNIHTHFHTYRQCNALKSKLLFPVFGAPGGRGQSEVSGLGIKPTTFQPLHSSVMHTDPSVVWECFVHPLKSMHAQSTAPNSRCELKNGSKIDAWSEVWLWCIVTHLSHTAVCCPPSPKDRWDQQKWMQAWNRLFCFLVFFLFWRDKLT